MNRTLEQVLADWRSDADALHRNLDGRIAKIIRTMADEVEESARDYLTFLPEAEAMLWTGRRLDFLRSRFKELEALGHAKMKSGARYYRAIVLPRRIHLGEALSKARDEGRAGISDDGRAA